MRIFSFSTAGLGRIGGFSLWKLGLVAWVLGGAMGVLGAADQAPISSRGSVFDAWRWRELAVLSEIPVRSMDQSPAGMLWLGGDHGLYRYDGYKVHPVPVRRSDEQIHSILVAGEDDVHYLAESYWGRVHRGEHSVVLSLEAAEATASNLALDRQGRVYLGISAGLYRFGGTGLEPLSTRFEKIGQVACTAGNVLWVSEAETARLAIYRIGPGGELEAERARFLECSQPLGKYPFQLFPDSEGNVWVISTDPDVPPIYFTPDYREVVLQDLRAIGGTNVMSSITESRDGAIWISARRFIHRYADQRWEVLDNEHLEIPTSTPLLHTLNDGSLLVTGPREKAMILNRDPARLESFEGLLFQVMGRDGSRWFLSKEGQVGRNSPDGTTWTWYGSEDGVPEIPGLIFASSEGTVWVAGRHGVSASVARFDGQTWTRDLLREMGYRVDHLSAFERANGDVLFGNGSEGDRPERWTGGLVRYRREAGGDYRSEYVPTPIVPYRVATITEDAGGTLYVGGPGFNRLDGGQSVQLPVPEVESPGWWVDHMVRGLGDELWLCVWGKGIYRYEGGAWERFSESSGLPSNRSLFALSSAYWNGIWASTQRGIARFDGQRWTPVLWFPTGVRRESNTLVEGAGGDLWINFVPRAWFFRNRPDAVVEGQFLTVKYTPEKNPPRVELVVAPEARWGAADVYFEWRGADFWAETPESGLEYSYRLGDEAWSGFAPRTQLVRSALKPGDYVFEVRVRDRDWNVSVEAARVVFTVVAPLWQRPWFIGLVVSTVALIVFLVTLVIRNRIKHLLEVEELKIQFFTYLSHELRTPLAVVLGPIESAMKLVENSAVLEKLTLAKRNANRVLALVDQLLDFRKFEYSKKLFNPQPLNLLVFLRDVVESMRTLAEEKGQRLEFTAEMGERRFAVDADMLQKLCSNLIGNAVKYSPEGSQVWVRAQIEPGAAGAEGTKLVLTVTDDGPGIDREAQALVFLPFYRVGRDRTRGKGTGLGLALVKDLVDAWGGTVALESPVADGKGTCFRLVLPVTPVALEAEVRVGGGAEDAADEAQAGGKELVLVVDDDEDFRTFLESELRSRFRVVGAKDGHEAMEMAHEVMPEVIVSDFHMPGMSGEALCRALKADLETCHIPVILLTSDQSRETELTGIKGLADEFLRKPLDVELLVARLNGLLESRRRLRELFSKQLQIEPKEITVTSTDESLLSHAIAVVEENMADDTFGVEEFSKKMAMSSRTLYRKLAAITGVSPSQFIRAIRLKRAAQLFRGGITVVSDVMVQVGILDASYFSRTFKKEFGKSPREFIAACETAE